MSSHAHLACGDAGVPLLRLERAAWRAGAGDRWTPVASAAEAAAALPAGARALVTVGRKEIAPFLARPNVSGLARMIEPPALPLPSGWTLLCERPPFSVESEQLLMQAHGIDCLVSKNAGGGATAAKLVAARDLGIPVIMVQRPLKPEVQTFDTPAQIVFAARRLLSP
jgi:precorrin-6A/cobalt-precorrin-6A reductase